MNADPTRVPLPVLVAFDLAGASQRALEGGRINRHWLVTSGDRQIVVRCSNPSRSRLALLWEQELVRHAGKAGWPVPRSLATKDGRPVVEHDGRLWTAAPFLAGEPQQSPTPAMYHNRGRLLARLHRDLVSFPVDGQKPGFGKTWELDAWMAPSGVGTFNEVLAAFAREHQDLASAIRRYRYRNLRELSRLQYPELPDMPVHGDFQRSNLLWQDGQLTGLIDFDFARRDAQVSDLATLLVPFEPLEARVAGPLLEGYESVRTLTEAEWALLPALARASLLWWLAQLLIGWRTGTIENALAGIIRTTTGRLPALDLIEPAYRALPRARSGSR